MIPLIVAITGLVGAVTALIHSVGTRKHVAKLADKKSEPVA